MPRACRDGRLSALNECLSMVADDELTGKALYRRIAYRIRVNCPPAYNLYCERFVEALSFVPPTAIGPVLMYDEWRRMTAAAREEAQLAEIVGAAPGKKLAQMRSRLLLADGEPLDEEAAWPYAAHAEQQERDGRIDAYIEAAHLMDEEKLDGREFGDRICRLIFDVWPADYLEYRQRYEAFFKDNPSPADIGPALEYAEWRDAVDELHAEAAKCETRSGRRSKRWTRLNLLLLRVPGERAPEAD